MASVFISGDTNKLLSKIAIEEEKKEGEEEDKEERGFEVTSFPIISRHKSILKKVENKRDPSVEGSLKLMTAKSASRVVENVSLNGSFVANDIQGKGGHRK